MKRSITKRTFLMIITVFLFVLVIQSLFLNRFFNESYYNSLIDGMAQELQHYTSEFTGGSEDSVSSSLLNYTKTTGSPVFAFNENYEVVDRELPNQLDLLTITLRNGETVYIPACSFRESNASMREYLEKGRFVELVAARVGNSTLYTPLFLQTSKVSYSDRSSIRAYRIEDTKAAILNASGTIDNLRYVTGSEQERMRAQLIFNHVKDCLIEQSDISVYLDQICSSDYTDPKIGSYRLVYATNEANDVTTYFVTLRTVMISGLEKEVFQHYFLFMFGFLLLLLVAVAGYLSCSITRPLRQLNTAAQKMAKLDFSEPLTVSSKDEFGQLTRSIEDMSRNLEQALRTLEKSVSVSRENEKRLQMLLSDLAHEFKTPLGIISAQAEVIQYGVGTRDQAYYFDQIQNAVDRLTNMVNEVIDLAKLESGYWSVVPIPCDLSELIYSALESFDTLLQTKDFHVKVDVTSLWVLADERRILQVLTNFLSNAIKYSEPQREISISAKRRSDGKVLVEIGNTGTVSPDDLSHIWERYYCAVECDSTRKLGDGIGLEIVRNILLQHSSEYGVRQENEWLIFYFTLEAATEELK